MTTHDDFPISPDCCADAPEFYKAYKRAKEFLNSIPLKSRGGNPDRTLYGLTTHLYSGSRQDVLFRASLGAAEAMSAIWLSRTRFIADWYVASSAVPPFHGLNFEEMQAIARLSRDSAITEVVRTLKKLGIILIHELGAPGMKIDGAVFKLSSGNPVVALSLRYARVDHYWFTLMHELSHVALHYDVLSSPILDDLDEAGTNLIERQANRMAADALIPRNEWRNCPPKYSLSETDVRSFAEKLGIAPQIVAGRLRKELNRYELFSQLINETDVREIILGKN